MRQLQAGDQAPRMLGMLPDTYRTFWTSGKDGSLSLLRNRETGRFVHPFWPVADDDPLLEAVPVSGRGTIFTYTVNHQQYNPAVPPPYVIAIVQLEEQEDLRFVTNIVDCAPDEVKTGMAVAVRFEEQDGLNIPVFAPA